MVLSGLLPRASAAGSRSAYSELYTPEGCSRLCLTRKLAQTEAAQKAGTSTRSFRRRISWCWNIRPRIPVTGELYDHIQLDGIYIGSWCCLVAIAPIKVIGHQWCDTEKRPAWEAFLERFPAPAVVVTDGGAGFLSATASLSMPALTGTNTPGQSQRGYGQARSSGTLMTGCARPTPC